MTVTSEIQAELKALKGNAALWEESQFATRAEALDFLEVHVLDQLATLPFTDAPSDELLALQQRAEQLQRRLEAVDQAMFARVRASIRSGECWGTALLELVERYVGICQPGPEQLGYDVLDAFATGVLPELPLPQPTLNREPGMVFYQQTPARIVFELAAKARFGSHDVFIDLGSGLGFVCLWVHLLSGVEVRGIEVEPAYCAYATACAAGLNLPRVAFEQADARTADYTGGTVFFLYTPFEGQMLGTVLERLRMQALSCSITVFTYGPCTPRVAQQSWLRAAEDLPHDPYRLAKFTSLLVPDA